MKHISFWVMATVYKARCTTVWKNIVCKCVQVKKKTTWFFLFKQYNKTIVGAGAFLPPPCSLGVRDVQHGVEVPVEEVCVVEAVVGRP